MAVQEAVTVAFQNDAEAISLLRATGLPSTRIPQNFTTDPDQAWLRVFRYFDLGAIRDPYRNLLAAVLHVYPHHDVLRPIAERHRIVAPEEVRAELAPEPEPEQIRDGDTVRVGYQTNDGSANPDPRGSLEVFLCHSSEDKVRVRQLYRRLTHDGINCWLDEECLLPGQDWEREIRKALRRATHVLVCISESSVGKSGYVQKELRAALDIADEQPDDSIFLIPVRLELCEIPERLRRLQWVDLFGEYGYERLVRSLRLRR
jgi:hypothetical protein